jgi:hypothetical protein
VKAHLLKTITICAVMLAATTTASAEYVLFEDFDPLLIGNVDDQNGWQAAGTASQVVLDPANGLNQVLAVTAESTIIHKDLTIANGTTRMLFFRFRFESQLSCSFGMSDSASPDQFGDFEVELSLTNSSSELRINNDGQYDTLTVLTPGVWYNCWMLIDNTNDRTRVWLHDRDGEWATPDDLLYSGTLSAFIFRDGAAGDLRSYYIKTGSGNSTNSGPLYIDDIYIEVTGTASFYNPLGDAPSIPTVSEWGLIILTLLMLCTATLVFKKREEASTPGPFA